VIIKFIVTIFIALIGSNIMVKLKVPAGALIGAVLAVGLFQIIIGKAYVPSVFKTISSLITGSFLGSRITKNDIRSLKKIPVSAAIMLFGMFSYNGICAYVLSRFCKMDVVTSFLATAPGGMSEMSLVAIDMNANSAMVSSIQVIRIIIVTTTTPFILRFVLNRWTSADVYKNSSNSDNASAENKKKEKNLFLTLLVGLSGGLIGKFLGVPSGALIFSMFACIGYNVLTGKAFLPVKARRFSQCFNGAIVGTKLLMSDLLVLKSIFSTVIILTLGWIVLDICLGWVLFKFGELNPQTALFAASAGGASDMGLISEEMGGNAALVSVLQMCRVVGVVIACPLLVNIFH